MTILIFSQIHISFVSDCCSRHVFFHHHYKASTEQMTSQVVVVYTFAPLLWFLYCSKSRVQRSRDARSSQRPASHNESINPTLHRDTLSNANSRDIGFILLLLISSFILLWVPHARYRNIPLNVWICGSQYHLPCNAYIYIVYMNHGKICI